MAKFERITLVIDTLPDARAQVQINIPTPMPGMRLETAAHSLALDALGWLGKQPAVAGFVYSPGWPNAKRFLSQADYDDLWRFEGMASDGEGYDISKDRMKRLAELGVVRWCGKDRYGITAFGQYVLEAAAVNLPLETYEEASARCNAEFKARIERLNAEALAAQAKEGGDA